MSYPKQVPPGWTKGEPVYAIGGGPRYGVLRVLPPNCAPKDEIAIEFDSHADCQAWLNWWAHSEKLGKPFAELPTEDLRAMASKSDGGRASWSLWTRDMLLAFFHNRYGTHLPKPKDMQT